jgi:hypothetical protein
MVDDHLISNRQDLESSVNRRTAGEDFQMRGKFALYALAVVVLMGTMAVAASADYLWTGENEYGPSDSSVSAQPEQGMDQQAEGEIRGPVETGALPDGSVIVDHGRHRAEFVTGASGPPQHPGRGVG